MADIHSLKKQLRGICSTQKLTKAMRTTSTVKFSKLNALYTTYAAYGAACDVVLKQYGEALIEVLGKSNPDAPPAVVVLAGNKGMCGSFNSELLTFAESQLHELPSYRLYACGKKAISFFKSHGMTADAEYVFDDMPQYSDCVDLLDELIALRREGQISTVYVIYPQYIGMIKQKPIVAELFAVPESGEGYEPLLIPDRQTIVDGVAHAVFRAVLYRYAVETALGAQAATVMTMRTAYDTATEYRTRLEGQINRLRQSAVTADVLETATEWG